MIVTFPYDNFDDLEIPDALDARVFDLPDTRTDDSSAEVVRGAMARPIGSQRLCELARGKSKVLIVSDDIHRPTPVHEFISVVLDELSQAGVMDESIEFLFGLGTHRPMTPAEMVCKLGPDIVERFAVHNHQWDDERALDYAGDTDQGVPVWINKKVTQADLVIGLGAIMPIEVSGFTVGGKIGPG